MSGASTAPGPEHGLTPSPPPDDDPFLRLHEWDAQHALDDGALGVTHRRRVEVPQRAPEGVRLLPVQRVESVDWTLAYPSVAEVHDPIRGRQLAVGDIHAETRRCQYHLSIMLLAGGGWCCWERLDPIGGEIRVRNPTDLRQTVKLVEGTPFEPRLHLESTVGDWMQHPRSAAIRR